MSVSAVRRGQPCENSFYVFKATRRGVAPRTWRRWAAASVSAIAMLLAVPSVPAAMASSSGASSTVNYWGSLTEGRNFLKPANTTLSPKPVQLPGRVAEVATSNTTYYALLTDGRVYALGIGDDGQLGNGSTRNSFIRPVRVRFPAGVKIASLPTNVMPYSTGQAVDTTGHAWGWGFNGGGELCLGNRRRQLLPVKLPFTRVTAVAGAFDHAFYDSAGQVWACGRGRLGELGDGKFHQSFVPVKVLGLGRSAHVVTLVAGFGNGGALLADGTYMDWGVNGLGQLGIGSRRIRSAVPVRVSLPAKVSQVAQGGSAPGNGQTLVLLTNGALYAWGADSVGQLGDGTRTLAVRSPKLITPPSGVTYKLLATTGNTSYGVTPAGDVYSWGGGLQGQIGNGTTQRATVTPVKVATGATGISGTAYDVLIKGGGPPVTSPGALTQLPGRRGCLVDVATPSPGCQSVRALKGPGPLLGSHAIDVSPDGKNLYVASRRSQAVAVFSRNHVTGQVTQLSGSAGCVSARGADGCAPGVGLGGPNSVAVSRDGQNVYATSAQGDSIAIFRRNQTTGALTQLAGTAGCVAKIPTPRCTSARGLDGPDIVAVSPDGKNVYVGAFFGHVKSFTPPRKAAGGVVVFSRDPSTGALSQLPGSSGCIVVSATSGCAMGLALRNPEGLGVSADGNNVYVAAPLSNAVDVFARNAATGALTQAIDGTGCLSSTPQSGCGTARATGAVDSVAITPDDDAVYFGGGISESIPGFIRSSSTGNLTQPAGTAGCVQLVSASGCGPGRPLVDPEGVTASPDGSNVYAEMYMSSALDVFARNASTGGLTQLPGVQGCFTSVAVRGCTRVRGGVRGVSSAVISPDNKYLYAVADLSNSLTVFSIAQ